MLRTELCTAQTFYMLMYVYDVYKKMQEKYAEQVAKDQGYEFTFYNYKDTGQNIVMRPDQFLIFEEDADPDDSALFYINTVDVGQPILIVDGGFLSSDNFTWLNQRSTGFCLCVGDHDSFHKRYVFLDEYADANEVFENYTEEYFFQQSTVQNIISYEQFHTEVNWYYNYVLKNTLRSTDVMCINDLPNFNLKTLEGFKAI